MHIEYEPGLVEKAVRLAVRGDRTLEAALHREADPLYRLEDAEARDRAFEGLFREWFCKLNLDTTLSDLLTERPLIESRCTCGIVREAGRRSDEGVELFVRSPGDGPAVRTLLVQLRPEGLVSPDRVAALLRRELLHVSDMLDDAFGYRAENLTSLGQREQLVRDRYRVLWDLYVESRLDHEDRGDEGMVRRLRAMFERVFTRQGVPPHPSSFDTAWAIRHATHGDLLHLARHPEVLSGPESDERCRSTGCPLCGCPTFDWFDFSTDAGRRQAESIGQQRPDWNPSGGACRQCVEVYALAQPAMGGC